MGCDYNVPSIESDDRTGAMNAGEKVSSGLFVGASVMLMGAHDGAVDHRVFVAGVCRQVLDPTWPIG